MPAKTGQNGPQRRPAGLGARGKAFWDLVVAGYDLTDGEWPLLVECARTQDVLERLDQAARREEDPDRQLSLYREQRLQRVTLSRLLSQLQLPDETGAMLATPRQARARHAADVRWSGRGA